ncbi:cell division protein FtsA [Schinkia azotoformans MEV2011]|uniref:Cell division protein FtsA n=1 Tax=Schinkia azotoformans MEV2011 TaxID=1348973 RepID=A0A072NN25_SCHAZ|nr:cell division protein FtsA [Schinkia azotoformans]KEF38622.1 cell division protein FtsA [Schinkia azotoformans MEV2011]MEC1698064.1 cell division protein FtsA [Schinkia azotoformans]MEC1715386.1 cell division protein FtsA [Schinkia azotoformans]MEC1727532.1 cell division protein FtsA [Schinkia azotoformans]MEC1740864.1 cell division protein FtsA [Schinkia azotoformans]
MNNSEIIVSLDIGTSNVKVIIAEVSSDSLNIIGVGNVKSIGIKKGSIVDIDETVQSIRKAVEQAERMVGMDINHVVVGVAGNHVQLIPCHGVVAVSSENREIGNEDIARVIDAAQVISIPPEREIIGVVPHQFIVDGLDGINDPRGMIGVRLEVEGTIVTGSRTVLHNLLRCVEKAGLKITDICLQPLATGAIALSRDEKNIGVALVDIGGGQTTVSIFEHGHLQVTTVLPIGGDHMTNDISIGLRTSTEEAERIKIKHGYAFYDHASEDEVFSLPVIGSDKQEQYSQLDLSDIIEARLEEILLMVQESIKKLGYRDLPGGYVFTGGVANLPGLLELAQLVLQHNLRIAKPDYIGVRDPIYTTSVGLIQFAYRNARLQGAEVAAAVSNQESDRPQKRTQHVVKKPKKNNTDVVKKAKELFKSFFE